MEVKRKEGGVKVSDVCSGEVMDVVDKGWMGRWMDG